MARNGGMVCRRECPQIALPPEVADQGPDAMAAARELQDDPGAGESAPCAMACIGWRRPDLIDRMLARIRERDIRPDAVDHAECALGVMAWHAVFAHRWAAG